MLEKEIKNQNLDNGEVDDQGEPAQEEIQDDRESEEDLPLDGQGAGGEEKQPDFNKSVENIRRKEAVDAYKSHEKMTGKEGGDSKEAAEQDEDSIDSLKQKLEKLLKEKEEALNLVQRVKADYDNYRKRAAAEKEETRFHALCDFMGEMLPIIDNLERALQAAQEDENVPDTHVEGINMIYKQISQLMDKHGVCCMDAEGCTFDPRYHQAVMQQEEGDYEPQTVVEELQKGYMMKDRILRPSMVKVYTGPGSGSGGEAEDSENEEDSKNELVNEYERNYDSDYENADDYEMESEDVPETEEE